MEVLAPRGEPMLMRVEVEPIPAPDDVTLAGWTCWCVDRGMRPLGRRGRRAWCERLDTYLRDATHVVYRGGEIIDLLTQGEADGLLREP